MAASTAATLCVRLVIVERRQLTCTTQTSPVSCNFQKCSVLLSGVNKEHQSILTDLRISLDFRRRTLLLTGHHLVRFTMQLSYSVHNYTLLQCARELYYFKEHFLRRQIICVFVCRRTPLWSSLCAAGWLLHEQSLEIDCKLRQLQLRHGRTLLQTGSLLDCQKSHDLKSEQLAVISSSDLRIMSVSEYSRLQTVQRQVLYKFQGAPVRLVTSKMLCTVICWPTTGRDWLPESVTSRGCDVTAKRSVGRRIQSD